MEVEVTHLETLNHSADLLLRLRGPHQIEVVGSDGEVLRVGQIHQIRHGGSRSIVQAMHLLLKHKLPLFMELHPMHFNVDQDERLFVVVRETRQRIRRQSQRLHQLRQNGLHDAPVLLLPNLVALTSSIETDGRVEKTQLGSLGWEEIDRNNCWIPCHRFIMSIKQRATTKTSCFGSNKTLSL